MKIPNSWPTLKELVLYIRASRPQVIIGMFVSVLVAAITITYQGMSAVVERNNQFIKILQNQLNLNEKEMEKLKKDKEGLIKKLNDSIRKDDILRVAQSTSSIIQELLHNRSGEYQLGADTKQSDESVDTSFYLEEKVGFEAGSYSIQDVYKKSSFIEAIMTYVATISQFYNDGKLTGNIALQAVFEGSADGIMKDTKIGTYDGQYDAVIFRNVLINGVETDVNLYKGDSITNSDLAFLRSYTVFKAYREISSKLPVSFEDVKIAFVANETSGLGPKYRFGKITIRIFTKNAF